MVEVTIHGEPGRHPRSSSVVAEWMDEGRRTRPDILVPLVTDVGIGPSQPQQNDPLEESEEHDESQQNEGDHGGDDGADGEEEEQNGEEEEE